ncbi:MAG: hypothetical protein M1831_005716 [Alyxoria varia]|nr:MAG: hypothetical protein M1831_005716 [Alyxoria varia]
MILGTNTYILGSQGNASRTLIDTGSGAPTSTDTWLPAIQRTLREESARIDCVLLTHWHPDHVGGLADLLAWDAVENREARAKDNGGDGDVEILKFAPENCGDFTAQRDRVLAEWKDKLGGKAGTEAIEEALSTPWKEIKDGKTIIIEWLEDLVNQPTVDQQDWFLGVKAVHCPGHTTDHCAFVLTADGGSDSFAINGLAFEKGEKSAMFTGDNVLGHGTAVFEDLATYMDSLENRMLGYYDKQDIPTNAVPMGFPAHGAPISDIRAKIREYLEHRKQREQQVLAVLSEADQRGLTSMQIVKVVYKDVPEALHGPAEGGVIQILRKLEGEGKVERLGGEDGAEKWRRTTSTSDFSDGDGGGKL